VFLVLGDVEREQTIQTWRHHPGWPIACEDRHYIITCLFFLSICHCYPPNETLQPN